MKLSDKLENISTYPFHMPAHKRNSEFSIKASEIDITEIDGFDNLHKPAGMIKELEDEIARLFGYEESIISVNGSTCCILSAISAVCKKGDKIIIARNCHKSVYNACFINELDVNYIEPEYNYDFGCYGKITQEAVDNALKQCPDACAVVITSPTYEGFVSNINCDIPLIIDAAHGAHFGFADFFPERARADIVIQSLHKTLPCLTQTAVVHTDSSLLADKIKKYMDIYETSSPSYVLLSSIDKCIDFLKSSTVFERYKKMLDDFYSFAENTDGITLLKNDDITRIILSVKGYSGFELAQILRADYGIEVEGHSLRYVILISSVCDTEKGFDLLKKALVTIEKGKADTISFEKPEIPEKAFDTHQIINTERTRLDLCEGRICAEYIYAYPPASPIIAPGEIISAQTIDYINCCIEKGINILCDSDLLPNEILTKA